MSSTYTSGAATPAGSALPLESGRWELDPAHSSVVFAVRHLGLSKVRGRFEDVHAVLTVGDGPADIRVEATIGMSSVNTNNADRDAHLRSTDFFKVEDHPAMTFFSRSVSGRGEAWTVTGDLTVNDVTKEIVLATAFNGIEPLADVPHAGFEAQGELKRSDFGIDFGLLPGGTDKLVIADTVRFELDLQFVRSEA